MSYHQLGKFIAYFQMAENEINGIMQLLSKNADSEMIKILINDLEYSKRLETADVMFARFVDLYQDNDLTYKADFHKLIVRLKKLGERRNELVHSNYIPWYDVKGFKGLIILGKPPAMPGRLPKFDICGNVRKSPKK